MSDNIPKAVEIMLCMGRLARRSDVEVLSVARDGGPRVGWKDRVPEDMYRFSLVSDGVYFYWKFSDDDGYTAHDIAVRGLDTNSTMHPFYRDSAISRVDDEGTEWILIEGTGDAGTEMSLNLEETRFQTVPGGKAIDVSSFDELIQKAIDANFALGWRGDEPNFVDEVNERLKEQVAPRKTFKIRVDSRRDISASEYRRHYMYELAEGSFDRHMEAVGRPERAATLDKEERGRVFDEVFGDISAFDAKLAKKVLMANTNYWGKKKTKGAFKKHYRCDGKPLIRYVFTVERLYTDGRLKVESPDELLWRILIDRESADLDAIVKYSKRWRGGDLDSDTLRELLRIAYTGKLGCHIRSHTHSETLKSWEDTDYRECQIDFIVESDVGLDFAEGETWDVSLLPKGF
ncbi:hypothetical protein FRC98_11970 [Lujinxingia vulgaris]|uniref:Uncharacterized protein n=1 Tax=Lujinxingia vulgaris TaxID=2600176 RepID=A0A5C6XCP6_9DELT|nr:hypothetical protein [Lujinxingia vulgaris]TXD36549.1 hypothetical protein FRC98_11970 [Lujinxingia vulgaris]